MKQKFTITIEKESNPKTGFSAFCRELSGCFSNGETKKDAVQNIREAIVLHLESFQTANNPKMFIDGATIPQVAKFLQGQCFVPLRKSGNHLTLYNHLNIVITVPIHKVPELGRKLILRVLKEAGCSPNDFLK